MYKILYAIAFGALLFFKTTAVSATSIALPTALAHSFYRFNEEGPFYNIDIYVKWDVQPQTNTGTYAGFQFFFENGGSGYFGTQIDSSGKKAIFSIWDSDQQSITAVPISNCQRFGHEGSGSQCITPFNWIAGREYMVRIWVLETMNDGVSWGGWIKDTSTGEEKLIGVIQLKNSGGYQGYGLLKTDAIGFHEHYSSGTPSVGACNLLPYSKVTWRGPYANNNNFTASSAVSNFVSTECFNSDIGSSDIPLVTMESGGSTIRKIPSLHPLWGVPIQVAPGIPSSPSATINAQGQIDLRWLAAHDGVAAQAYRIYRNGSLLATTGNVLSYVDAALSAASRYTYAVAACDAAGNCSPQSNAVTVETPAIPSQASNVKSNCLFDWAGESYPVLFSPRISPSFSFGQYYVRQYLESNSFLAVSSDRLLYVGPLSGNSLVDLGDVLAWYSQAGCAQP